MIKEFQKEYRFLSNFWPCTIELDGWQYACLENAYQAAKTFNPAYRVRFSSPHLKPWEAKSRGRQIPLREDWEAVKLKIMEELVRYKFTAHEELKEKLLATGEQILQEGNMWNYTFWGVDLKTGKGENNLGKILMSLREELKRSKKVLS
jgi:ribA/ribD-fused uncharacterized protein